MPTTGGVHRVLVAEDDPLSLNLLISMLTSSGYLVDFCENGRDALALLNQRSYSLLITDLKMPMMDGDRLIREMRAMGNSLPTLVVTGSKTPEAEALVSEFECVHLLPKPYHPDDLIVRVGEMVGKVSG